MTASAGYLIDTGVFILFLRNKQTHVTVKDAPCQKTAKPTPHTRTN